MSELVPATADPPLRPMGLPDGWRSLAAQPAVRRALPYAVGLAALGGVALTWSLLAPAPQRTLYSQLSDTERSSVVGALDKAAIAYSIDAGTGALTVGEDDFYRARMLVAADGAVAAPESGAQMLDSLPIGASRTMEGERLRAARERELVLTIQEIEGVEAVRVHIAEGEKSVFVRDDAPPTASVMLRLARGRQLGESQTAAIVNLVAASVPGLAPDAVRVVDQHGRLLSSRTGGEGDRLDLQARMEEKLRAQVEQLLTPMLGAGNFTSEIQVELDMAQVTSARESYDKQGAVRSETQEQSQSSGAGQASGVPGVLANSPPPTPVAKEGAPQGTASTAAASTMPAQSNGESSVSRTYELGREVAVSNTTPGALRRLSVAVAISDKALKGKPADIEQVRQLVSAAVGANPQRGDQVAVVARKFETVPEEAAPFYEASWFAAVVRHGVALLAVLMVLLLGVRPLIRALKREPAEPAGEREQSGPAPDATDPDRLSLQVSLAQRMVEEQPENAVAVLRQMLRETPAEAQP